MDQALEKIIEQMKQKNTFYDAHMCITQIIKHNEQLFLSFIIKKIMQKSTEQLYLDLLVNLTEKSFNKQNTILITSKILNKYTNMLNYNQSTNINLNDVYSLQTQQQFINLEHIVIKMSQNNPQYVFLTIISNIQYNFNKTIQQFQVKDQITHLQEIQNFDVMMNKMLSLISACENQIGVIQQEYLNYQNVNSLLKQLFENPNQQQKLFQANTTIPTPILFKLLMPQILNYNHPEISLQIFQLINKQVYQIFFQYFNTIQDCISSTNVFGILKKASSDNVNVQYTNSNISISIYLIIFLQSFNNIKRNFYTSNKIFYNQSILQLLLQNKKELLVTLDLCYKILTNNVILQNQQNSFAKDYYTQNLLNKLFSIQILMLILPYLQQIINFQQQTINNKLIQQYYSIIEKFILQMPFSNQQQYFQTIATEMSYNSFIKSAIINYLLNNEKELEDKIIEEPEVSQLQSNRSPITINPSFQSNVISSEIIYDNTNENQFQDQKRSTNYISQQQLIQHILSFVQQNMLMLFQLNTIINSKNLFKFYMTFQKHANEQLQNTIISRNQFQYSQQQYIHQQIIIAPQTIDDINRQLIHNTFQQLLNVQLKLNNKKYLIQLLIQISNKNSQQLINQLQQIMNQNIKYKHQCLIFLSEMLHMMYNSQKQLNIINNQQFIQSVLIIIKDIYFNEFNNSLNSLKDSKINEIIKLNNQYDITYFTDVQVFNLQYNYQNYKLNQDNVFILQFLCKLCKQTYFSYSLSQTGKKIQSQHLEINESIKSTDSANSTLNRNSLNTKEQQANVSQEKYQQQIEKQLIQLIFQLLKHDYIQRTDQNYYWLLNIIVETLSNKNIISLINIKQKQLKENKIKQFLLDICQLIFINIVYRSTWASNNKNDQSSQLHANTYLNKMFQLYNLIVTEILFYYKEKSQFLLELFICFNKLNIKFSSILIKALINININIYQNQNSHSILNTDICNVLHNLALIPKKICNNENVEELRKQINAFYEIDEINKQSKYFLGSFSKSKKQQYYTDYICKIIQKHLNLILQFIEFDDQKSYQSCLLFDDIFPGQKYRIQNKNLEIHINNENLEKQIPYKTKISNEIKSNHPNSVFSNNSSKQLTVATVKNNQSLQNFYAHILIFLSDICCMQSQIFSFQCFNLYLNFIIQNIVNNKIQQINKSEIIKQLSIICQKLVEDIEISYDYLSDQNNVVLCEDFESSEYQNSNKTDKIVNILYQAINQLFMQETNENEDLNFFIQSISSVNYQVSIVLQNMFKKQNKLYMSNKILMYSLNNICQYDLLNPIYDPKTNQQYYLISVIIKKVEEYCIFKQYKNIITSYCNILNSISMLNTLKIDHNFNTMINNYVSDIILQLLIFSGFGTVNNTKFFNEKILNSNLNNTYQQIAKQSSIIEMVNYVKQNHMDVSFQFNQYQVQEQYKIILENFGLYVNYDDSFSIMNGEFAQICVLQSQIIDTFNNTLKYINLTQQIKQLMFNKILTTILLYSEQNYIQEYIDQQLVPRITKFTVKLLETNVSYSQYREILNAFSLIFSSTNQKQTLLLQQIACQFLAIASQIIIHSPTIQSYQKILQQKKYQYANPVLYNIRYNGYFGFSEPIHTYIVPFIKTNQSNVISLIIYMDLLLEQINNLSNCNEFQTDYDFWKINVSNYICKSFKQQQQLTEFCLLLLEQDQKYIRNCATVLNQIYQQYLSYFKQNKNDALRIIMATIQISLTIDDQLVQEYMLRGTAILLSIHPELTYSIYQQVFQQNNMSINLILSSTLFIYDIDDNQNLSYKFVEMLFKDYLNILFQLYQYLLASIENKSDSQQLQLLLNKIDLYHQQFNTLFMQVTKLTKANRKRLICILQNELLLNKITLSSLLYIVITQTYGHNNQKFLLLNSQLLDILTQLLLNSVTQQKQYQIILHNFSDSVNKNQLYKVSIITNIIQFLIQNNIIDIQNSMDYLSQLEIDFSLNNNQFNFINLLQQLLCSQSVHYLFKFSKYQNFITKFIQQGVDNLNSTLKTDNTEFKQITQLVLSYFFSKLTTIEENKNIVQQFQQNKVANEIDHTDKIYSSNESGNTTSNINKLPEINQAENKIIITKFQQLEFSNTEQQLIISYLLKQVNYFTMINFKQYLCQEQIDSQLNILLSFQKLIQNNLINEFNQNSEYITQVFDYLIYYIISLMDLQQVQNKNLIYNHIMQLMIQIVQVVQDKPQQLQQVKEKLVNNFSIFTIFIHEYPIFIVLLENLSYKQNCDQVTIEIQTQIHKIEEDEISCITNLLNDTNTTIGMSDTPTSNIKQQSNSFGRSSKQQQQNKHSVQSLTGFIVSNNIAQKFYNEVLNVLLQQNDQFELKKLFFNILLGLVELRLIDDNGQQLIHKIIDCNDMPYLMESTLRISKVM